MAEFRTSSDYSRANTSSLQRPQATRPHRPGRTITCYYCGFVLHEKHLQAHMKQCHLVLEGCPNKCGVTVERHDMQNHLDNICTNRRQPTSIAQTTTPHPNSTINRQAVSHQEQYLDSTQTLNRREIQQNDQPTGEPDQWNEKVVAALMVIKKSLLKEENERCRAEAELKLELKRLAMRVQTTENNTRSIALPQVGTSQFHELKEEILLLKESLAEERQERHRVEQQLAYEVEKSNICFQEAENLKMKLEEYHNEMETWKLAHETEVDRLLQEVFEERQQRLRAETELKMEAANLKDLCCTLEQWRDVDKSERSQLEDQHKEREVGWKGQVKQKTEEIENLKEVVQKCCHEVDEFREFLSTENVMISGLWTEQLAEVRSITGKIDSLNKMSEVKSKEIAQLKQHVSECDEALTRVRGGSAHSSGHIVWKISDFDTKMLDAKKNNTVLHSPVFYTSQHGYKLRVEVRLNGMGQWTGRHMTASLQVLEGEWDPLLKWPFNQRVTLALRDQSKDPEKVNNLVKNLVEGREKEDPAGLYVFIPHATLQQHCYVFNDIMFLEVNVG